MHAWPGFEGSGVIRDHVIRYLPRDYPIFRRMRSGDQYPAAVRVAERLVDREIARLDAPASGRGQKTREKLRATMVPPYPLASFPNRWWKLNADHPSRTLLAHLGEDSSRIFTMTAGRREPSACEKLRGSEFSRWLCFPGSHELCLPPNRNAVPPLLAFRLADQMAADIRSGVQQPMAA